MGHAYRVVARRPILAGERVIGTINLESIRNNAFSESDVRLLSTVASSMGVALEKRAFSMRRSACLARRQRAAELAIVNESAPPWQSSSTSAPSSSSSASASRRCSRPVDVHGPLRPRRQPDHLPIRTARGKPYHTEPFELGTGLTSIVISSGEPLLLRTFRGNPSRVGATLMGSKRSRGWAYHPGRRPGPRRHRPREPGTRCL